MLPLVPKPELIEEPSTTVTYENHQTDVGFDDELLEDKLRQEQITKGAQTFKSLSGSEFDLSKIETPFRLGDQAWL